jgi:predicted AAA+ superfamily ATPase
VDVKTAQSYIDLMCDLLLVRRLRPWHTNVGKRLVRTPKVYVRDSGLVHALLNIDTTDALLSHMVIGASWEGYCIENILACAPDGIQAYFYRTSGGAEIDLLLLWPGNELWAIEIKRGHAPKVGRGFYSACEDLKPTKKIVVSAGQDNYPIGDDIRVMSLENICQLINGNS